MTHGDSGEGRLSVNARREAARMKARVLRDQQKKKERRTRLFVQSGLIVTSLAIIGIVALVIVNSIKPAGPGPNNMLSDGITIGQNFKAVLTPGVQPGSSPVPSPTNGTSKVIDIRMYVDYQCPHCKEFEAANASQLATWLHSGAATVQIHPIAILNNSSQGNQYSTRAANAAACVANYSPNSFWAFNELLYATQPAENSPGRTDAQLVALTVKAKVTEEAAIAACVKDTKFKAWVNAATIRALQGPIPDSNVAKVQGTPTVIVNGQQYLGSLTDPNAFASFVFQAEGKTFTNTSPSPSPSP